MLSDLPNVLTLSRIAAIPVLVLLAALHEPAADWAACAVFSAAAFTDWLDGHYARARGQQSDFGRMMDPIADKLLVAATLMMLVGEHRLSHAGLFPALVILLREILVSGLREFLAGRRLSLPVSRLAKWKTGVQMVALGTLLAGDAAARYAGIGFLPVSAIGEMLLWVAAMLTLLTGWDYLTAGVRQATNKAPAARQGAPAGLVPPGLDP